MSESFNDDRYWAVKAQEVEEALLARVPENKIRARLEPTARLAELLGEPQKSYRIIHVTGTNGKTSTSRFTERILRELGLRTGRLTSPHLVRLNERISIDGESVSDERLFSIWKEIEPIVLMVDAELAAADEAPLTFFEVLTVLAFAIFADAPIDVLVLEVGMGGTWDSTNIADADVAVFTPISLDHTDRLGKTQIEIAATKAGIIKPGSIVVTAKQDPGVLEILQNQAAEIAEKFLAAPADFNVKSFEPTEGGQQISIKSLVSEYSGLNLPIHGSHQAENAVLAVAAVEAFLGGANQRLLDDVVRAAFSDFSSPGRLQRISHQPQIILDAAHNAQGAKSLAIALKESFGSPFTVGVVSILMEKDARALLEALESTFVEIVITQSDSPRATPAADLAALAREVFGADRVHVEPSARSALELAASLLPNGQNSAIVVTGSITLVGQVLKYKQLEEDIDAQ